MQWLDQLFTGSYRDKLLLISGTGMLLLAAVVTESHAIPLLLASITLLTLTHKPRIARAVRRSRI